MHKVLREYLQYARFRIWDYEGPALTEFSQHIEKVTAIYIKIDKELNS